LHQLYFPKPDEHKTEIWDRALAKAYVFVCPSSTLCVEMTNKYLKYFEKFGNFPTTTTKRNLFWAQVAKFSSIFFSHFSVLKTKVGRGGYPKSEQLQEQ